MIAPRIAASALAVALVLSGPAAADDAGAVVVSVSPTVSSSGECRPRTRATAGAGTEVFSLAFDIAARAEGGGSATILSQHLFRRAPGEAGSSHAAIALVDLGAACDSVSLTLEAFECELRGGVDVPCPPVRLDVAEGFAAVTLAAQ